MIGQKETVFDKPMTPGEIQSVMYSTIQPYDVIGAVLQQVCHTQKPSFWYASDCIKSALRKYNDVYAYESPFTHPK